MASKMGMAVDLCMAHVPMPVLMTLTLVQSIVGWQRQQFSVEQFQQLSKQRALHFLQVQR